MNNTNIMTMLAMVSAVGGSVGAEPFNAGSRVPDEKGKNEPTTNYYQKVYRVPDEKGKNEPTTNYYQKVYRVPDEKGKRTYSKIVTKEKADRLINGVLASDNNTGKLVRVPLKRTFVEA